MTLQELQDTFPAIILSAQEELDAWVQDANGHDEVLGAGGACGLIADRISEVLSGEGFLTAMMDTDFDGGHEFVMADIPGLIEGASEGRGLGDQFLGHVERSNVLLHLVDGTSEDVATDARTILTELEAYSPVLMDKPRVTALNKIDALDDDTIAERKAALEAEIGTPVLLMSGVAKLGVTEVLRALWAQIEPTRRKAKDEPEAPWQP